VYIKPATLRINRHPRTGKKLLTSALEYPVPGRSCYATYRTQLPCAILYPRLRLAIHQAQGFHRLVRLRSRVYPYATRIRANAL